MFPSAALQIPFPLPLPRPRSCLWPRGVPREGVPEQLGSWDASGTDNNDRCRSCPRDSLVVIASPQNIIETLATLYFLSQTSLIAASSYGSTYIAPKHDSPFSVPPASPPGVPHPRSLPSAVPAQLFPGPEYPPPPPGTPTGPSRLSPSPTPFTLCSYFTLVAHTHSHACTHLLTHSHTCSHTCIYLYAHMFTVHTCDHTENAQAHMCILMHTHAHPCGWTCILMHTRTCIHTRAHAPWCTQTHTCTHTGASLHQHTMVVGLRCTVITCLCLSPLDCEHVRAETECSASAPGPGQHLVVHKASLNERIKSLKTTRLIKSVVL